MRPYAMLAAILLVSETAGAAQKYFTIKVVDDRTGRGVPLVELETVNRLRYVTDSNGLVAFYEPGLMNRRVFFHVRSHGYQFPKDGFGYSGKALDVAAGRTAVLKIRRLNIAERLYRVTGAGIYRDSLLVGAEVPISEPALNASVFGSDSVVNAVYRGRIYWFWGDTNRPSYPLGNFHVPGATSKLPYKGGLDPSKGVDLAYFSDQSGFARPTARMPGTGPTWISGLAAMKDNAGKESLFASYVKIRRPLTIYERGLARWNDVTQKFDRVRQFPKTAAAWPGGHTFAREENGVRYVYFCQPFPLLRVRADVNSLADIAKYEAFSCLKTGSRLDDPQLDRRNDGTLRYGWKPNTPIVNQKLQTQFVTRKLIKPSEGLLQLRDVRTGKKVLAHSGSVCWNAFRRRWVMIFVQSFGRSFLGEVWYAEADTPIGPWVYAVKVVTHDKYSFYNPKQHPMFDQHGGRTIYFEGTYTKTFSAAKTATPRYDYNQIMYRLQLDNSRSALPVPVYSLPTNTLPCRFQTLSAATEDADRGRIAFFAFDRAVAGTAPVWFSHDRLVIGGRKPTGSTPIFYAYPADEHSPPHTATPLYEFVNHKTGRRAYSTDQTWKRKGFTVLPQPFCLVWKNPYSQ